MKREIPIIILTALLAITASAWAGNSVVVETMTVAGGAGNVDLGIHITNDLNITGIVIPLEFRSLDPGAYMTDTLSVTVQGRFAPWANAGDSYGAHVFYAIKTVDSKDYPSPTVCAPDSAGLDWYASALQPDFVSPDALLYAAVAGNVPYIEAGTDSTPGEGIASLSLRFNVTETPGDFEVDTVCIRPGNHLLFVDGDYNPLGGIEFTKGVVRISDSCGCDCHADPVCDSVHNVLDLVAIVGVAFQGADPIPDPDLFCPYETTDVNCNDVTDVLDAVLMNQVINYGANPDSTFCDPCGP